MALIHEILPRPNHIGYPLSIMSKVWDIINRFPVEKSKWMPYWKNKVKISDSEIKCSYYKFTDLSGKDYLLAFISNITPDAVKGVTVAKDLNSNGETKNFTFNIDSYDCKILFIK